MEWTERITNAEKAGKFSKNDRQTAANWFACSLGERIGMDTIIKNKITSSYELMDYLSQKARNLGCDFLCHVETQDFAEAHSTNKEIQALTDCEIWKDEVIIEAESN